MHALKGKYEFKPNFTQIGHTVVDADGTVVLSVNQLACGAAEAAAMAQAIAMSLNVAALDVRAAEGVAHDA
jgi:hypothetical protein